MTLNPYFKGATVGPVSEVLYANQQNYENFTLRVLPEVLFSVPVAVFLPKNHFLVNEINSQISILNAAGLVDYWITKYLHFKAREVSSSIPKKLNVGQLQGGLLMYLAGCGLGFLVFLIELFTMFKSSRRVHVHDTEFLL